VGHDEGVSRVTQVSNCCFLRGVGDIMRDDMNEIMVRFDSLTDGFLG
jgi:hypothetical protein